MQIISKKHELHTLLQSARSSGGTIGLVPTMGALHKGHVSLIERALGQNDRIVVSIFVNPTQFDNQEDLKKYPRNFNADVQLLKGVSKEIIVFTPTKEHIYEGVVQSKSFDFNGLDTTMEGTHRKGHFEGVATIVELLFRAVQPDRAYFGEKDYQQLQIIKHLVREKDLPVEIVPCAIEREANGLARSSRNERLTKSTREEAGFIHQTLKAAKAKFGTDHAKDIVAWVTAHFKENELFELEYFEITDAETLMPIVNTHTNQNYRAFVAVYAEGVRLIDNIALN